MLLSTRDEAFWDRVPAEFLRTLVEQGRDNGSPTAIFALGDPYDLATPGIAMFKAVQPNHVFPRHCHDCERFEVVVDGSFRDGAGNLYQAGDVMVAHHMDMYGPHRAEPGGYTVVEYFGSMLGTYELFWDSSKGPRKVNKLDEDRRRADTSGDVHESPMHGDAPPAFGNVATGSSHQSIHDDAFWNHVPAAYLQPLVDHALASGYEGMAYRMFALGDPDDAETPAAVLFRAPAGYTLARHSRDCHRLEVVIEGSFTDEHGQSHSTGAVMTAEPNQMSGPLTAGPNGYTSVEFFSRLVGTYEVSWDTPRGPSLDNRLTASR